MATDEFEEFLTQLGKELQTVNLDEHVGWARSNAVLQELRRSAQSPEDPDSLLPSELAAVQTNHSLALDAALAMDHWNVRADGSVVRAFLRSEMLYGPVVTREHSPYVLRLPTEDGSPIGVEGSERLWGLTALIEATGERDGLICRTYMTTPTPHMEVSAQHDVTGTVRYKYLVRMYETGADDDRIVEALAACEFDDRKALFVLRDGITPPLADGML